MSSHSLKNYQRRCLDTLAEYLKIAREKGADAAFDARPERDAKYRPVPEWPESAVFPYVCVRVPTGGGKTLMAAHALGLTAKHYLHGDRAVALWMAPTDAIVQQTLKQLRDRTHPVRQALMEAFGGQVEILSMEEALYVTRPTLDGAATVIVSTVQAWRTEDKEGNRKVYKPDNGALMAHFDNLPQKIVDRLEKQADGKLYFSLANVLKLRKPIIIADEAHNFRTQLTFDTLKHFDPAAILEFTATPGAHGKNKIGSNVLVSASAAELNAEDMIKAPVILNESAQWRDAVQHAVAKQAQLQEAADAEYRSGAPYLRPIVLLQAQPDRKDDESCITVNRLRSHLVDEMKIPADQVVFGTGDKWEVPDDLLKESCPVRFVITVQALREGWDCPFAYVLCTVSTVTASTAVEQILGRVLRMPQVTRRKTAELNQAYCYTSSGDFGAAARSLKDALIHSGFGESEAEAMVTPGPKVRDAGASLFQGEEPIEIPLAQVPTEAAMSTMPAPLRASVSVTPARGQAPAVLVYQGGALSAEEKAAIAKVFDSPADPLVAQKLSNKSWGQDASPAALGEQFAMPGLALASPDTGGALTLFDGQQAEGLWTLEKCDARVAFDPAPPKIKVTELNLDDAGEWREKYIGELRETMLFQDRYGPRTLAELSAWLDREIQDVRLTQQDKRAFIDRALAHLVGAGKCALEALVPVRWRLAEELLVLMDCHRIKAEHSEYQRLLDIATVPQDHGIAQVWFNLAEARWSYPGLRSYTGNIRYAKHYFEHVGEMNAEEANFAQLLDACPQVKYWVRNLERGNSSFWLPKAVANSRFYPDFIAILHDGRHVAAEYKGVHLDSADEAKDKKALGELWEKRSGGRAVFLWATKEGMEGEVKRLESGGRGK